ncbi:hypothetical protein NF27_HE00020 [Candidatus Jidaibacter acanthamoeba]|uniref:Uncharacterized protein n=1 Tax=Candidatus Jidaibacter acanthamoebae TaxID=86105 RepID=A0A0C1QKF0_9RICK|nr:hypothetical protein [Candidatus Jidaibacter acanthamoeba]KIE04613.1 hypothetical protein NF27_HE00020 [Candidatus Jidaibacter acanthamoeba]
MESVISHIKQNTQTGKELLHKAEELRKAIESSIPPYLLDLSKLKLKNLSGKNIIGFQEADLTSYAYNISSIFDNLLTNLISNIETYKGEPGREIELESLLLNAISLSNYLLDHNNNYFYFNAANIGQNYVLQDLLAQTQSTINKDLIAEHNNIKHNLKDKFSKFEKRGFEILANLNFGAALSKEEQQYLAKFFEYAIDNQEFNSRITRILNNNDQFVRNNAEMIAELRAFTYKTADLEGVGIITNKVEAILKKIKDNQTNLIEEEDKLSYQELGRLVKFLRNKDILMALKELKILEHSTILQYLNSNLQTSNNLYMELDSLIKNHINYEQGDIVMEVAKRNREFYSNKVNYEEKIRDYMSPYTHAAIGYKDNRGVFVSHVDQTYTKDKIEMDAVLSENFRIYPDKLIIDNDVKKQIIKALKIDNEDNLKQKMYDIYKGIASELHQLMQDENKDIKFDRDRAKDAFIADLMPFGFGHMGKDNIKSWAKEVLENKASLAQKIKDPGGKGYLFCSEFAAKMTVLSLVELEKQLFDKIKENDPNFEMPKGGLLKMPFHEYEDLGKVHPARLVKELSKSGAIEKVPEAEMVKNIIRTR